VASGISAAGRELADILDDEADSIEPLLRIRAGTPVGILFTAAVTDGQENAPATISPAAGVASGASNVLDAGIPPLPLGDQ